MTRTLPRPTLAASLVVALSLALAACGGGGGGGAGLDEILGGEDDMDCGCDVSPIEPTPTTAP